MIPALAEFAGVWTLARRIDDRCAGQAGRFDGTARFTPDALGLVYEEEGRLALGRAAPLHATRRYLWRPARGGGVAVLFPDGRPFHAFGGDHGAEARHWCDPDTYRVRYDFAAWPRWQAAWTVTGPAKDYTLVTDYAPAAGPA